MQRIVLAYSGGLDTSVAIPWLAEQYGGAEIMAVTLDLGQGQELEDDPRARARDRRGARARPRRPRRVRARVHPAGAEGGRDLRGPVSARDGARPAAHRASSWSRSRDIEGATAIAHGCTGKGNDQVRLDVSARALDPKIKVIAPARVWGMTRPEEIEYARAAQHSRAGDGREPVQHRRQPLGPVDRVRRAGGSVDEPPEEIYTLTKSPDAMPGRAGVRRDRVRARRAGRDQRRRDAARGADREPRDDRRRARRRPHRHGGEPAGRHQVARDLRGARRRRAARRAPELEKMVIPRDLERLKHDAGRTYADLVYNGLWFTPTREAIDAFVAKVQETRHRHDPAEAVQGRLPRRRAQVAVRALRARRWRPTMRETVRSLGGRRVHQDLGAAGRDRGAQGRCRGRSSSPAPRRRKRRRSRSRPRSIRSPAEMSATLWSGRFAGEPDPTCSPSARRFDSTAGSSRMTSRAASRGPRRSRRQAC